MKTVEVDGRTINDGQTVTVDHFVQTFTVTVRSMTKLTPEAIKDQLQKRWEVLESLGHVDDVMMVRNNGIQD